MTKIIKFIADDGTEFEDGVECKKYEWSLKYGELLKNCRAYDRDFDPIPLTQNTPFEDLYYLYVDSAESAKAIERICAEQYASYYSPFKEILFPTGAAYLYYDNIFDTWVNIEEAVEKLKKIKQRFNEQ